ncbi:MAG: ATP-binding protein, partial [Pirellulaceae bacterium]
FDKSGAPRGCVGAFIDITERERIEARNKFLVRLDDAIRPLTEASEITHTAARLLAEQLDVDRCAYADVDDLDDDAFNLTGDYNRGVPSIVGRYRFSSFGQEVLQRMRDNQPYVVDDVLAHEPTITDRAAYEQTQIRAVICVPLHKGGRFAAAMAVHQRTARHWTAGDVELVELVASRCWESIERARVARNLLESEERLRMAVAAARIGYWTWELETELVQLDSTCAELLGMATSQAPPELVLSAIHPDDRSSVDQAVRDAIEGRGPYKVEFRVILPDGETRWLSSRGNGVRVAGRVWRLRGVNMDITEQIQLAEQREQLLESERAARASAERAGRMKDEFLATLSHELRTPLNAVLGYATLMKFAAMNSVEVAEAVDAIERNARLQAQLIEDLLDMNRIMSGKIRLDVQTLSLDEVIKAALDTVLPSAETKGVRIQKVVDPLAGPVRGDPARLQQVVWNLLSNAIKFTPRDGSVQIALERVDSRVEITVSDTGQGITADFLPFVFDRFRQADPSTTRRHGGLGLGLSIVKHLVDLHGGSVRVSSPGEGQGATFVVSLPLAIIHHLEGGNGSRAALAALSASPGHGMNLSGVRVLVVDDEPDATVLVKRILEECQATVTTAHSAQEALEAVRQHPFEVLVSDIGMPGQDGFQLLRAIRSLEGPRSTIPAVALTAFARSEDRRRAALAGFQTHLSKPVEIAELIAVVGNLAGRTKPPADS